MPPYCDEPYGGICVYGEPKYSVRPLHRLERLYYTDDRIWVLQKGEL